MNVKDLIATLVDAGMNCLTGQETKGQLEAILEDAKANGVRHILSQDELDELPDQVKADAVAAGSPLEVGSEIRRPWPKAGEDADEEAKKKAEEEEAKKAKADAKAKAAEEAANAKAEREAKLKAEQESGRLVAVVLARAVKYAGKIHEPGSKIEVTAKDADALRASGALK